jgi:formate dehydrogenase iron-sulfur subunit
MTKALLFDATLCIGCKSCEEGCAQQNGLPYDEKIAEEKQSAHKYTTVLDAGDEKFMRRLCMHCLDPACASVCPVAALYKSPEGPVVYDGDKCMGCRYCMVACPFGVPKYEWAKAIPLVQKCTGCLERLKEGKPTACSESCPTEATITGDRDALIAEAHRRIRENPEQYINYVYGEKEVGGTSTLMLSSVPFETFGFKTMSHEALPDLTFRILKYVPEYSTLSAVMLGGIYWICNRRNDVAEYHRRVKDMAEREEGGSHEA